MTEQSYRIDLTGSFSPGALESWTEFFDEAIAEGLLVPDSRLQDIANAWNKPTGNQWVNHRDVREEWPALADLLDELIRRNNDRWTKLPNLSRL